MLKNVLLLSKISVFHRNARCSIPSYLPKPVTFSCCFSVFSADIYRSSCYISFAHDLLPVRWGENATTTSTCLDPNEVRRRFTVLFAQIYTFHFLDNDRKPHSNIYFKSMQNTREGKVASQILRYYSRVRNYAYTDNTFTNEPQPLSSQRVFWNRAKIRTK